LLSAVFPWTLLPVWVGLQSSSDPLSRPGRHAATEDESITTADQHAE